MVLPVAVSQKRCEIGPILLVTSFMHYVQILTKFVSPIIVSLASQAVCMLVFGMMSATKSIVTI